MNPGLDDTHPAIEFYDADYPSAGHGPFAENFDAVTEYQGIAADVDAYLTLARSAEGDVLEACCGTGRIAIPLARAGFAVTAVDISPAMLAQGRANAERADAEAARRITWIEHDVTALALERRFALAIIAFNSLLCIPSFQSQRAALRSLAAHLAPGGRLAVDCVNPLLLKPGGEPIPHPFYTRRHPRSGNLYTRFFWFGPFDSGQAQALNGWYDEILPDGTVRRRPYAMRWRPIYRFELELMLAEAGLKIARLEGGHRGEAFTPSSPRMFVVAERM